MPLSTDLLLIAMGIVIVIIGGLHPYMAQRIGWRTWSSYFSTPELRARAQKQEKIGQLLGVLNGAGLLLLGSSMLFSFSSTITMLVLGVWIIGVLTCIVGWARLAFAKQES